MPNLLHFWEVVKEILGLGAEKIWGSSPVPEATSGLSRPAHRAQPACLKQIVRETIRFCCYLTTKRCSTASHLTFLKKAAT